MDPALASWFKAVDTSGEGVVDSKELQRALALGGMQFDLSEVDSMIRAFDSTNKRGLDVTEFQRLHVFLTTANNSFYEHDADRSGQLSMPEVYQALARAGFQLDPPVLEAIVRRHDPDKTGTLKLAEYVHLCLTLQTCIRAFSAFDTQRTGKVTLTFNQFVYAASYI